MLYEGLEDHFLVENAIPYATYEFEIFAYTYEENIFLANSKAISFLTPSESKQYKRLKTKKLTEKKNEQF